VTRIKICGISSVEHALATAEAGADYIGMVFAESRRQVSPEKARGISGAIYRQKHRPHIVGVFAGTPVADVNRIAGFCNLDLVQLSGGETWDYCLQIGSPLIKVIHIAPGTTTGEVMSVIEEGNRLLKDKDYLFLLDTGTGQALGGTGQVFDWAIAQEVAAKYPVMVAGGLTPDNVTGLIKQVHPWGVDVSGGVESGGIKDIEKIKSFIQAVKQADAMFGEGKRR